MARITYKQETKVLRRKYELETATYDTPASLIDMLSKLPADAEIEEIVEMDLGTVKFIFVKEEPDGEVGGS